MKAMFARSLLKLQKKIVTHSYIDGLENLAQRQKNNHAIPIKDSVQFFTGKFKNKTIYMDELAQLPDKQLRTLLKISCPIAASDFIQIKKSKGELLQIFKRLRQNQSINQSKTCSKCPFLKICPVANKIQQQRKKATLQDLLLFLYSLNGIPEQKYSILRWSAAYKTIISLSNILEDLDGAQKEGRVYRSVLKEEESDKRAQSKKNKVEENSRALERERKYKFE